MRFKRAMLAAALAATAAGLSGPANADEVGQIVTYGSHQYEVKGVVEGPAVSHIVSTSLINAARPRPAAPSCTPSSVSLNINNLTGTALVDVTPSSPTFGATYYKWNATTWVKVEGNCDSQTHNQQWYVDQPVITTNAGVATGSTSPMFDKWVTGNAIAAQSPDWMVMYYNPATLGQRAVYGSLKVNLRGSYIVAPGYSGAGTEKAAGCITATWFFFVTPTGPQFNNNPTAEPCTT